MSENSATENTATDTDLLACDDCGKRFDIMQLNIWQIGRTGQRQVICDTCFDEN